MLLRRNEGKKNVVKDSAVPKKMPGDRQIARLEILMALMRASVPVSQAKLDQSCRHRRFGDLPERSRRRDLDRRWEPENRMVPKVKDVHACCKLMTLPDMEVLD